MSGGNRWEASHRDDYFADLLAEPFSDRGLGDVVRFDHSSNLWHVWNGARWRPDETDLILDMVRDCVEGWIKDDLAMHAGKSVATFSALLNTAKKKSVLEALASYRAIAMLGDEWDHDPDLLGFENGVLNLRTGVFYHKDHDPKPDPKWLVSRSTGLEWDDAADQTPFLSFVEDITSHDYDVASYLLKTLGYSLIGSNQEQKFWMWVGPGSNGKGILARTVAKALGDYAYSPPSTLYMRTRQGSATANTPRPELLKLQGARFTFMSEPDGGQFNEELLKAHTGNDPIEARTLYSARYKTFYPTHKVHFLTNTPPKTDDVGPSMQRRVRIIQFNEDYSLSSGRADNTLESRLQTTEAMQGALVALTTWALTYLQTNDLPEPQIIQDWSKSYISDNDPITEFIKVACVEQMGATVPGGKLYEAFANFCTGSGYDEMASNTFGRIMGAKYPKKRVVSGSEYQGIRLKNATDWVSESSDGAE